MEYIKVNDTNVHYICEGEGQAVILLHGWGQNIEMMKPVSDHLKHNFKIYVLDFPGFGNSDEPSVPWGVEDYTIMLRDFITKLNIENPILIGHSFGCRVCFHYAAAYPVKKMILTGAAGLKDKHGIDYYIRTYTYKTLKHLTKLPILNQYSDAIKAHFGSSDYKNTTGIMRTSFVKIVNDDVKPLLKDIKCPVLLIYGEKDDATPLWMGKYLESHLKDAGLVVFENATHYAYLEQLARFLRITDSFLNTKGE